MADLLKKAQVEDGSSTPFSTVRKGTPPVRLMQLITAFRNRVNTKFLAGPEPPTLPEQGYHGDGVQHKDMETITGDWSNEYGPHVYAKSSAYAAAVARAEAAAGAGAGGGAGGGGGMTAEERAAWERRQAEEARRAEE